MLREKRFLLTAIDLFLSLAAVSLVNCIYSRTILRKLGPPKSFLEFINIGDTQHETLFFLSHTVSGVDSNNFLQMSARYSSCIVCMIIMYYCYVCTGIKVKELVKFQPLFMNLEASRLG